MILTKANFQPNFTMAKSGKRSKTAEKMIRGMLNSQRHPHVSERYSKMITSIVILVRVKRLNDLNSSLLPSTFS